MPNALPAALEGRFVSDPVGAPGFDLPDVEGLRRVDFSEIASIPNISVDGPVEPGSNFALIPHDFKPALPIRIRLSAITRDVLIVIGTGSRMFGQLRFNGPGHTMIFAGADVAPTAQTVEMNGLGNCFFLGRGSSSNGLSSHIIGQNIAIVIGENLLAAHEVRIMTSDMHGLIDTISGDIINPPQGVRLDPHVWLAENSTVLKGSIMGFGSVLGLGSILTRSIPARCIAAGVPARVVRENTTWLAHSGPDPRLRATLKDLEHRTGM